MKLHIVNQPNRRGFFPVVGLVFVLLTTLSLAACIAPNAIQAPIESQPEENSEAAPANETGDAATTDEANVSDEAVAVEESAPAEERVLPVADEEYKGMPVGFTAEGYPFRGAPDAPVTMYEYSDYQCPFCNRHFIQTEPALNESYVRSGQMRVVFRDFPLEQLHPSAPPGHVATTCVIEQGSAAAYWEMHDQLFRTAAEWGNMPDTTDFFVQLAEEAGLDAEKFASCFASGRGEALLEMSIAEARSLGFNGTPSFRFVYEATGDGYDLVGAQPYDQFATYIETIAAGESPQTEEQQANNDDSGGEGSGEFPYWATTEGLAPDPNNPGHTMAGDPYRGNPDAEVAVVEFSDFQCPFCMRHTTQTQPILDEQFVDSGKVFWVFKHFPLSIHPQAPAAGTAAECAAEQGQFWEMHELLFANMQNWSTSDPTPVLTGLGEELGLDMDAFNSCMTTGEASARVQSDMQEGAGFVRGTPTFVVLYNNEGRLIPGALPAERFTVAIQEILTEAGVQ